MHGTNKVGIRRTAPGMTEWGKKARKAEAKTKKGRARREAIREGMADRD